MKKRLARHGFSAPVTIGIDHSRNSFGPLSVTAVSPTAQTNLFTATLLSTPLTVAPGSTDNVTLSIAFAAPGAGQTGNASQPTVFTLTCNDPEAAPSGATAHPNTLSVFATAGNFEIVFALDLSGSMATADAGGQSRWAAVQRRYRLCGATVRRLMTRLWRYSSVRGRRARSSVESDDRCAPLRPPMSNDGSGKSNL